MSSSGFADGIEFEETFPEAVLQAAAPVGPAPRIAPVPASAPASDATELPYPERLERRLLEAETLVKQTIERMRIAEEQRLVEWVQDRRAEEERRLAKWVTERHTAIERSLEQRTAHADGLAERLQAMLVEWQGSFEKRFEQRHAELEQTLTERVSPRHVDERAPLPERSPAARMSLPDRVAATTSARDVGRVIRDVVAELTDTAAFALSVHQGDRDEVAYRYRVASDDELGALLRSDALDDGAQSAVAHMDDWARAQRTMRVGSRNLTLHTAQLAVRAGDVTVGVLTLRTEKNAIADTILARVRDLVALCAPHLAALRENGSYRSV